ncbi:PKD domain-containing protein [uncultured Christiangramia sp.]|uniref:PKD domain-containing protein n=1 Tax=uncultured Christiangramia sp. TaxID=503836 RepID=UPI002612F23B|nr:PKD domain-containing protein [uncultured Christiangramia sp.]
MKIFRILAMLTISLLLFTGCEDDEITNYAFQEISAPTDVTADFDISQDDTGTVTITPSGVGAQTFQVDFGNGETAELANGETATTVYDEGVYLVKVVAVGSTGLTSEFNQRLTIAFKAPENLEVNVNQLPANPAMLEVSATADNAASFDVYFGDTDDEEPTQLMPGETISYTYAAAGTYTIRVVAKGAGAATAEETVEVEVPEASDPLKLPVTFDDPLVGYAVTPFGAAETAFDIVTNPQLSGTNDTESMVGAITKAGAQFEGVTFNLGEAVDFSGDNKTLTVKIYSEVAFPVLLKLETGVNGERSNEVDAQHAGTGWETLTFNFATEATTSYIDNNDTGGAAIVPDGQFDRISLFLDQGGSTAGIFYVDDLMRDGDVIGAPMAAENLPIGFEDNTTLSGVFEGGNVTGTPIANPDMNGNNSATVYEFVKGAGSPWYSGVFHIFPQNIDLSQGTTFSFKMWSPKAGINIRFQLEKEGEENPANVFIDETITEANQWVTLTYDFSALVDPADGYDKFVIFPEFDDAAQPAGDGSVYYFDDIMQGEGTDGGEPAATTTSFPVDFESAANGGLSSSWRVFENGDNPALEIITNPDMTGNTSMSVAKFTARPEGQSYAGTVTTLNMPFTLDASNSIVKVWVWKSKISDVGIKFENGAGGSTGEIKVANTKTNEWEELTFDFSGVIGDPNNTDITGLVVFPDFEVRTSESITYFDNITLNSSTGGGTDGGSASGDFALPLDFESDDFTLGANSVPFEIVTNPEQSGINATANAVGKVTNNGGQYEALSFILDEAIDFSGSNKTITMKVYSEVAYPVLFKLETGVNGERANQVQVQHGGTGWEELTFDFANAQTSYISEADPGGANFIAVGEYDEISIFLDFAGFTAGEFYIDDIEQN